MDCINLFFSLSLLLAFDIAIYATRSSSRILSIGAPRTRTPLETSCTRTRSILITIAVIRIKQQARRALVLRLVDVQGTHNAPEP